MKKLTPGKLALAAALVVFLFSLLLCWLMPALPELFWLALEGNGPVLPCLLLALLAGLFCWLHALRCDYDSQLNELEQKLDTMKKD